MTITSLYKPKLSYSYNREKNRERKHKKKKNECKGTFIGLFSTLTAWGDLLSER